MSPRPFFPFQFGALVSSVSTPAPVSTDPWSKLALFAEVWQNSRETQLFPRFERVFPSFAEAVPVLGSLVTLTYRVSTQFPFIISSVDDVRIASKETVPA